jgi:glycosyltransferase involved in cell wall biosynthesis
MPAPSRSQDPPVSHPQGDDLVPARLAPGIPEDAQERKRLHDAIERLIRLYDALLDRQPSTAEVWASRLALESRSGMLLKMGVLGLSREARRRRGWLGRLVRCADASPSAPPIVRRWVTQPVIRALERLERCWPDEEHPRPGPPGKSNATTTTSPRTELAPIGLTIVGYLSADLGLGEAARSLARSCLVADIPVAGIDVSFQTPSQTSDDTVTWPAVTGSLPVELLYVNADQTLPTRALLGDARRSEGLYRIGFWHWEQPQIPLRHHAAFAHLDEVWVPSTFVQDAVAPVSPVPVFKVPHAVKFTPSPQASRQTFGLEANRQLVLVMFDFHSFQYRKNPQAAIAAFRLAAKRAPSLGLVVKTQNGKAVPEALAELHACLSDLPHVTFIDEVLSRQQMWDLQSCCDILLSLHRAEGFGLGPAEMMFLGKPVVATGWSATMDFMDADNSMPVRFELLPLTETIGPYDAGPVWAEADIDHAAWCLGRLADDPVLMASIGARAQESIQRMFDPLVIGRQVADRLSLIARWQAHRG